MNRVMAGRAPLSLILALINSVLVLGYCALSGPDNWAVKVLATLVSMHVLLAAGVVAIIAAIRGEDGA